MTLNVEEKIEEILRLPYKRTLVPEDEGGYSALIEEFPGCYAQGETVQEAYENLEAAAKAWLGANIEEGRAILQPVAYGGSVSGRLLLRLPKSLHRRSRALAGRDGVSLNQVCVMALTEAVARSESNQQALQIIETYQWDAATTDAKRIMCTDKQGTICEILPEHATSVFGPLSDN